MITTPKYERKIKKTKKYTGRELIQKAEDGKTTAFIGTVAGQNKQIYLIVYDKIVQLSCPRNTWTKGCTCHVERFVNLIVEESLI